MTALTLADWQNKATRLDIEGKAFIAGQYVDALSGQTRSTFNVSTGEALCEVAVCSPEDAVAVLEYEDTKVAEWGVKWIVKNAGNAKSAGPLPP